MLKFFLIMYFNFFDNVLINVQVNLRGLFYDSNRRNWITKYIIFYIYFHTVYNLKNYP